LPYLAFRQQHGSSFHLGDLSAAIGLGCRVYRAEKSRYDQRKRTDSFWVFFALPANFRGIGIKCGVVDLSHG
jgi:hypothetical protein